MKEIIPKTKKECFAQLDEMLSEEDKQSIIESKDVDEFHFSLGLWIRNNWIYGNEEERVEALAKDLGEEIFWNADSVSSALLDGYKKHLRQMSKLTK